LINAKDPFEFGKAVVRGSSLIKTAESGLKPVMVTLMKATVSCQDQSPQATGQGRAG